jgi:hypothetical protein
MTHLSRDALARYLIKTDSPEERIGVDWHLEHCPICKQEITARDVILIARDARERPGDAVRSDPPARLLLPGGAGRSRS